MRSDRYFPFFRPADAAVLLVLLLVAVLVISSGSTTSGSGPYCVEIRSCDSPARYPIDTDTVITVEGLLGDVLIQVEDSRARIGESPCPGQDCVRRGWLEEPGDMSVCVPSGVYIVVTGGELEAEGPDAITY